MLVVPEKARNRSWIVNLFSLKNNTVIPAKAGIQPRIMRQPCIYILASTRNGTLYIGVTSNIIKRIHEHRSGSIDGFSKMYRTYRLVYAEPCDSMASAIQREKQLKKWRRQWKLELIEQSNPEWDDLYPTLL